jgi:ATP-dependent exoDNAse (exonuclease V) beta subunit
MAHIRLGTNRRSRFALLTTTNELNAIAAAAMSGERRNPNVG